MFETLNSFVLTILAVMAVVAYTGKEMQHRGILKVKRPTHVRRFRSAEAGQDLIEYAFKEKHVIIVAPTSFLAYLQTVLQGLRALQIEESAKEIRKRVEALGRHLLNFDEYMKKLGGHLGTAVNTYNTAYKELGKIDKDVLKISGEAGEIEPMQINGPAKEEEAD